MEMRKHGAIDIGSNSIKLLVGFVDPAAGLQVVTREKENVRLGRETFRTGKLSAETVAAGAAAVSRLAGLARASGADIVRAVATCAVREAANASEFVAAVREACGVDVDVISGDEEARLVTLGVRSALPAACDPFFLIDIGGGSTELVVGDGERVLLTEIAADRRRAARGGIPHGRPGFPGFVESRPEVHSPDHRRAGPPGSQARLPDLCRVFGLDPVAGDGVRGRHSRPGAVRFRIPDALAQGTAPRRTGSCAERRSRKSSGFRGSIPSAGTSRSPEGRSFPSSSGRAGPTRS